MKRVYYGWIAKAHSNNPFSWNTYNSNNPKDKELSVSGFGIFKLITDPKYKIEEVKLKITVEVVR